MVQEPSCGSTSSDGTRTLSWWNFPGMVKEPTCGGTSRDGTKTFFSWSLTGMAGVAKGWQLPGLFCRAVNFQDRLFPERKTSGSSNSRGLAASRVYIFQLLTATRACGLQSMIPSRTDDSIRQLASRTYGFPGRISSQDGFQDG